MDFKENLRLKRGYREKGFYFYDQPQRALFGVLCIYKEGETLKKKYINFVSEVLNKDSQYVMDCFSLLE